MIDPKELRIGNWVHLDFGNWSYRQTVKEPFVGYDFQWEDRDWYAVGECTIDLDHISPIPLTPEILDKCGFDSFSGEKYPNYYFTLHDECIRVYVEFKTLLYVEIGDTLSREGCPAELLHIKYLHQLQNLYYTLTGEELNYQP